MDHYEHLMTERMKYTWISSANKAGAAEQLGMFGYTCQLFFPILLLFIALFRGFLSFWWQPEKNLYWPRQLPF
jgi:hypothetical protein